MREHDDRPEIQAKRPPLQRDFAATSPARGTVRPGGKPAVRSLRQLPASLLGALWGVVIGAGVFMGAVLLCTTGLGAPGALYKLCVLLAWRFVAFLAVSAVIGLILGMKIDLWRDGNSRADKRDLEGR